MKRQPDCEGVIAAITGNHGQSIAVAATAAGLRAVIVAPEGNNPDKNRAMVAQGAELEEYGQDFQESYDYAQTLATQQNLSRDTNRRD